MHARVVLGVGNVPYLERCPQLSGLDKGFHCSGLLYCMPSAVVALFHRKVHGYILLNMFS